MELLNAAPYLLAKTSDFLNMVFVFAFYLWIIQLLKKNLHVTINLKNNFFPEMCYWYGTMWKKHAIFIDNVYKNKVYTEFFCADEEIENDLIFSRKIYELLKI